MTFQELIKTSFHALWSNKLRTGLTILGIIIGITAVITLLNLGEAAQSSITGTINSLGSNIITILPGKSGGNSLTLDFSQPFTKAQLDTLIQKPGVYYTKAAGVDNQQTSVQFETKSKSVTLTGVYGDFFAIRSEHAVAGRQFTEEDNKALSKVAVIGSNIAKDLFENENPVGKRIKIGSTYVTIIGVNEPKGSVGFTSPDDAVYIPMNVYQKVFTGTDAIFLISVQARDEASIPFAEREVSLRLRAARNLGPDQESDFTIRNASEFLSTINQVTSIFTAFLAAIGGISLLVGGIGIMNIMFVTVRERTREIGLRKALGATNRDILLQFLAEAVVITTLGGIVGTTLGVLLSLLFSRLANIPPVVSIQSILLSVGFSSLIGLVFGIYPAQQASKLSPIDALRFE